METNNAGTWSQTAAKTNHYGNDSDSPSWIVEDAAQGTVTRTSPRPRARSARPRARLAARSSS
ncbi:hypothetical protein ACIQNG_37730 [Streptomyces sp. NPDC091377]|uniref:hypothetical protein n=1 Tax=Streptomyces sp. NPDC091377 TaxID=3365995 RepID=UPI003823BEFF